VSILLSNPSFIDTSPEGQTNIQKIKPAPKDRDDAYLVSKFMPHLDDGIGRMRSSDCQTVRHICGEGFWQTLDNRSRRRVGEIVSLMVINGHLLLRRVDPSNQGHERYQRK